MATYGTSGAKIYIGDANDTANTLAALKALTYTEIKEVDNIGDLDDSANEVSYTSLGDGREKLNKGTYKAIRQDLLIARDATDPGQIALKAASKTNNEYPIKIVLNDQPADGTNPTSLYYRAVVMGFSVKGLTKDSTIMVGALLGGKTEMFEEAAS